MQGRRQGYVLGGRTRGPGGRALYMWGSEGEAPEAVGFCMLSVSQNPLKSTIINNQLHLIIDDKDNSRQFSLPGRRPGSSGVNPKLIVCISS